MCMLHRALASGVESGESFAEDAVVPTSKDVTQRFEHYELAKGEDGKPVELGRGAMGVTYKAFDVDLRCPVTLKAIANLRLGTRIPRARRGPKKVSVARLPITGSDVFGREEDIAFLDAAWANAQVNIVTIVAWAGAGKSTLVNHWLGGMAAEHYRSAQLVFAWSFYRQGKGV